MQAIITKYFGPTNSRGSRIKAQCAAGSVTIPYPYALWGQERHRAAAVALCQKLQWTDHGALLGGQLHTGDYVFVFDNAASRA